MRAFRSLAALALAASLPAAAGFDPETVDLQTPAAPAFNILGVSPEVVSRPTTPRAVAVDSLSGIFPADASGLQTFALQVAPYWLVDHPDLSWKKFVNGSCADSLLQSLTVSVATSAKTDLRADEPGGAGLGLRTMCFVRLGTGELGEAAKKLGELQMAYLEARRDLPGAKAKLQQIETEQRQKLAVAEARLGTVAILQAQVKGELEKVGDRLDAVTRARLEAQRDTLKVAEEAAVKDRNDAQKDLDDPKTGAVAVQRAEVKRLQQVVDDEAALSAQAGKVEELLPRQGIALDLSVAMAVGLPEGERASVLRTGAWGTLSWRPAPTEGSQLELSALGRYLTSGPEGATTQYFDYGGRMTFQAASVMLAVEAVRRQVIATDTARTDTWRSVMTVEIPANDDIKLGFTFGKDFKSEVTDFEPLIAVLGVKIQLGKKPGESAAR